MARKITKKAPRVEELKTSLQQFVDSGTYRDEIMLRQGVASLIQHASPMLMDWAKDETEPVGPAGHATNGHGTSTTEEHEHSPEEVAEALRLGVNPMLCPGTSYECAIDLVRVYKVSSRVSHRARRRMHRVIDRYIRGMNRIARKEGRGQVDLRVRINLTPNGPELAFGLASEYPGRQV